jgi:hypothetical protein
VIWCKPNLSTFRINALLFPGARRPAILAAAGRREPVRLPPRRLQSARIFRALMLLFLFLAPLPNRARPRAVRVPFHTVQSMILVDAQVNGNRVTFLLDTGSNNTIVSVRTYGDLQFQLHQIQRSRNGPGMTGESLRLPVELALADRIWVGQRVSVMNLDDLKRILGISFDGLLGQDILRQFRSVRIDYHAHVIELEE